MRGLQTFLLASTALLCCVEAAASTVEWATPSVQRLLVPGFTAREKVSFTSSVDLNAPSIFIAPTLQEYVKVSPALPRFLRAGVTQTLEVTISIPSSVPPGTTLKGTIHVRIGSSTIARPLKLLLRVEASAFKPPDPTQLVRDVTGNIYPQNQLLILLHEGDSASVAHDIAKDIDAQIVGFSPSANSYQLELAPLQNDELNSLITSLAADPRLDGVSKNINFTFFSQTDLSNLQSCRPGFADAYKQIKTFDVWDLISAGSIAPRFVNIGIIDSGIDRSHPEFQNVLIRPADAFISLPDGTLPTQTCFGRCPGHGTAVSGILGASNDLKFSSCVPPSDVEMNGLISGVPNATYFLDVVTNLFVSDISPLIDILAGDLVSTVNASVGKSFNPDDPIFGLIDRIQLDTITLMLRRTVRKYPGVLFVFAAGDDGVDSKNTAPANLGGAAGESNVLTVAATDLSDKRATGQSWGSSNFGTVVDITAPGVGLYAPSLFTAPLDIGDYYVFFGGTSSSAPMVTGTASILKAIEGATSARTLSPQQIKNILVVTADPIQTGEPSMRLGTGCYSNPNDLFSTGCRLNALRAVQQALAAPTGPFFDFAVDSLTVAGNVNSGAGFFDDFNDSSLTTPPTSNITCSATVNESSGFLRLNSADGADGSSPGFLIDNCYLALNVPTFRIVDGGGDAVITASFRADVPGPGQGAGLQLFTFETNEIVNMNFSTGSSIVALASPGVFQSVPVNLAGVQRVMLRLTFRDSTNEVTHSFSLDNGATFTNFVFPQPGKVMTTGSQAIVSVFGSVQR
jgi:subtilisin family serine protease